MKTTNIGKDNQLLSNSSKFLPVLLTAFAFIMSLSFVIFDWLKNVPAIEKYGNTTIYSNNSGIGANKVRIAVALATALALVFYQKKIPVKLKILPYIWVIVEYVIWIAIMYQTYSSSEKIISYASVFLLHNATWADIVILLSVLISSIYIFLEAKKIQNLPTKSE
jgi:hypothetical protein